jgi:transcription elongation GreA/GreB family factor
VLSFDDVGIDLMSVAFRRDGDEEHLEPKFELPIPPGPNLVTPRGLALITQRIAELEAELAQTQDERVLAGIQRDLRYWTARQISAELAPPPVGDKVELGTRVSMTLKGAPKTFEIVGDDEADPAAGLISFNSPLSRAIAGASPGEILPFAGLADAIEVLEIEAVQNPDT